MAQAMKMVFEGSLVNTYANFIAQLKKQNIIAVSPCSSQIPPPSPSGKWPHHRTPPPKKIAERIDFCFPSAGGEALEFTVRVFKSSNVSAYVETTVTVVTIQSDLIAVIDGGKEFTVGRDSGELVLNAGNSIDPDEEARAWEYEWQCLQVKT